jgi:hypothetical protein
MLSNRQRTGVYLHGVESWYILTKLIDGARFYPWPGVFTVLPFSYVKYDTESWFLITVPLNFSHFKLTHLSCPLIYNKTNETR